MIARAEAMMRRFARRSCLQAGVEHQRRFQRQLRYRGFCRGEQRAEGAEKASHQPDDRRRMRPNMPPRPTLSSPTPSISSEASHARISSRGAHQLAREVRAASHTSTGRYAPFGATRPRCGRRRELGSEGHAWSEVPSRREFIAAGRSFAAGSYFDSAQPSRRNADDNRAPDPWRQTNSSRTNNGGRSSTSTAGRRSAVQVV